MALIRLPAHENVIHPSPITVQAEDYTAQSGTATRSSYPNYTGTGSVTFTASDWASYTVYCGAGVNTIKARTAAGNVASLWPQVRLATNTGTLIGNFTDLSNAWGDWSEFTHPILPIAGVQTIVIVAQAGQQAWEEWDLDRFILSWTDVAR